MHEGGLRVGPTSPRRPPPPRTAHRSPFRHAPSTRRGLLGGAPKEEGCCGTAWQRIRGVSCCNSDHQPESRDHQSGDDETFRSSSCCVCAAGHMHSGSVGGKPWSDREVGHHPAARGISPTDPARPPTAPPCRPTATRHNAMHDDDAVLSRRLSHSPRSRSPPSAHPHRPEPRTGNRPTSGPFRSLNL